MDRIQAQESTEGESSSRVKRNPDSGRVLFTPDCIFCNKVGYIKTGKGQTRKKSETTSRFERDGHHIVVKAAKEKGDHTLLARILGEDLFAVEAHYHDSCKKRYVQRLYNIAHSTPEAQQKNEDNVEIHKKAFEAVVNHIEEHVILNYRLVELTELNKIFIQTTTGTEFHNPNHKTEDLLKRIMSDSYLPTKISYTLVTGKGVPFNIIYNIKISIGQAISAAYVLSRKDLIEKSALQIRNQIKLDHQNSEKIKWPPKVDDLIKDVEVLPERLQRFLSLLFTGKSKGLSDQAKRLVFSIRQDICRAVTNGEWVMAKHILLCVAFRHMFRSKQVCKL